MQTVRGKILFVQNIRKMSVRKGESDIFFSIRRRRRMQNVFMYVELSRCKLIRCIASLTKTFRPFLCFSQIILRLNFLQVIWYLIVKPNTLKLQKLKMCKHYKL